MAFRKQLFCQYHTRLTEMCDKSAHLLKDTGYISRSFQLQVADPFRGGFSSGVSVVQKLNVGFANTVYFTDHAMRE